MGLEFCALWKGLACVSPSFELLAKKKLILVFLVFYAIAPIVVLSCWYQGPFIFYEVGGLVEFFEVSLESCMTPLSN